MKQEGISGNAQGCMVMQPAPVSPFIVTQAELLFQFPVVAFDAPAHLGDMHQAFNRSIDVQDREEVLQRFGIAFRPLDQQPLLRTLGTAPIIAVSATDTHGGKARRERFMAAFALGDPQVGIKR